MKRLLKEREASLNRQLGVTMFFAALAYALCWFCSLSGVFLTGWQLGTAAFLPGALLLLSGAYVAYRHARGEVAPEWVKYYLLAALHLAILDVSLIQLIWAVPCLVGFAAIVFAYHNKRVTTIFSTLIFAGIPLAAALNAWFGFPNPDMIPYPASISGIPDGFVNLWAVEHPDEWSRLGYFLRVLRLHTLPLIFMAMIVIGCGYGMARRTRHRLDLHLEQQRRLREVEACLLLMAGGNQSNELLLAVLGTSAEAVRANPPLSDEFVASIPAESIPALMRRFRARCAADSAFAASAALDPEAALRAI